MGDKTAGKQKVADPIEDKGLFKDTSTRAGRCNKKGEKEYATSGCSIPTLPECIMISSRMPFR